MWKERKKERLWLVKEILRRTLRREGDKRGGREEGRRGEISADWSLKRRETNRRYWRKVKR